MQKPTKLWRNDITGLRALAVLPVLIYHAFPSLIPGGYFGVDIFFVISGYLISGIIFRGLLNNTFSYSDFYAKRIRRIIPNLVLLLFSVALFGWFFLMANEYRSLGKHILSSSLFFQNFTLLKEVGYFTEEALRQPLLHLWSLAIEEQFYIVFPIICTLIWKFRTNVKYLGFFVLLLTTLSFIACVSVTDRNFNFYFPLTRFWEIGVGALLAYAEAFGLLKFRTLPIYLRNAASVLGLILIILAMMSSDKVAHPGFITLAPVLGAALLILSYPDALINKTLLCWRPMTFVGIISYSLYLWHWPILSYLFICVPQADPLWNAAALVVSFIVATLVYTYVENPVRRSQFQLNLNWMKFRKGATSSLRVTHMLACLLIVTAGSSFYMYKILNGIPSRGIHAKWHLIANREGVDFKKEPSIKYYGGEIVVTDNKKFPSVLLVGDSHAQQYFYRLKKLAKDNNIGAGIAAYPGCFPFVKTDDPKCQKVRDVLLRAIDDPQVKVIAIANKWGARENLKEGLTEFSHLIQKRPDLKVYTILDAPWDQGATDGAQGTFDPLRHLYRFSSKPIEELWVPLPKITIWSTGNATVTNVLGSKTTLIDPYPYICNEQQCNLRWYRDDDHLKGKLVETHGTWLDAIFQ